MSARGRFVAPLILAAAAFLAYGGPLITRLGFYHDDWWFLNVMFFAPDGFGPRLAALLKDTQIFHFRPLDAPIIAALYSAFGLEPLGWQSASLVANLACALAAWRILALFGAGPRTAVLGALLALVYPNKDAAAFWPTTVIIPSSYALFLGGYLAHLDWVRNARRSSLALASLCVLCSLAIYEQSLFQLAAWAITPEPPDGVKRRRLIEGLGVAAATAAAFLAYKFLLVPRLWGVSYNKPVILSISNFIVVSLRALESSFGWRLALSVGKALLAAFREQPVTAVMAAALPWAAWTLFPEGEPAADGRAKRLALLGGALFILGYLPFTVSDYRPTPLTHMNRINMVPAGGLALAAAAAALGSRRRLAQSVGAALVSVFLAAHVGFAGYWAESWRLQSLARDAVINDLAKWPADTTLLFRWERLMIGDRAPLLLMSWDTTGAVRVWTGDKTRSADNLRPGVKFTPGGVAISQRLFAYPALRVLDVAGGRILRLQP